MEKTEVIVVGGGISGIAFAWKAARAGRAVLLLESGSRFGGCLHSHRTADGYWYELGAHTTYNSYGGFLDIAAGSGAAAQLVQRGPARARFGYLRDGAYEWMTPPALLRRFNWLEIALNAPFGILRGKNGRTMAQYYGGLLGPGNYARWLKPFLAAVPSQDADGFPADGPGSLFKKRPRRKEFPRSFGFDGGLQTVCDAALRTPGIRVETGAAVARLAPSRGGLRRHDGGRPHLRGAARRAGGADRRRRGAAAPRLPGTGAGPGAREDRHHRLPRRRAAARALLDAGVRLRHPRRDLFFSAVTRDPFPDPQRRSFTFHFRRGTPRGAAAAHGRGAALSPSPSWASPRRAGPLLPSPALGHDRVVADLDRLLAGRRLALTGNYFQGLAIEDCVQRSFEEYARIA